MKNKKLITLLFCAVMSMSVAVACSDNGDNSSNDSTPPASDVTTTTYTVTFAGADISAQTIDENGKVAKPNDPVKTHYTFNGWYNGETLWDFETDTVTSNLTLTAKFTAIEYTITFKVDGEQVGEPVTYTVEDDTIVEPNVPLKEGYGGKWEPYTLDGGNKEVNVVYTPIEYTITFKADGEQVGEVVKYTVESETISEPAVPAKDYYTGVWETYTLDGSDKTVNAVYTPIEYTITFKADGEQVGEAVKYTVESETISEPAVPAKDYYTGVWETYTLDGGDKTVNAVYTPIEYTITFKADGKQVGEAVKYTVESETISEPAVPAKDYYTGVWETYTLDGSDKTVNAVYTPIEYTITFKADGEQVGEAVKYTVESETISEPAVPAKDYYTGVWETYTLDGGDKTVNAVYTPIEYTITFKADGKQVGEAVKYTVESETISEPAVPAKDYYTGVWETYTLDSGDKTVNAVYTPIEYTLKFIDFNGQETTATYNVENKDEFALPALPAAPEHYENARWNKTLEDCLVFSKETIVVEAIADAKTYMVAFNTMGASGMEAVGVKYNETLVLSNMPELDGYVFKGWTLNGEAYDMNTPVTEDIILVATWYKETNDGKKVVYSNDDVAQNAIKNDFSSEVSSVKETGWDWYYDTDYLFNPSASTMNDANRLWNMAKFVTYSTKNGANNISLPAINFTLYSKVDFGVTAAIDTSAGAGLTDIKLNGVSCGGYEYRLISVAEENGKYYATVYKVNEAPVFAKVELTDAMAKGQEPLTLTVESKGSAYAWIGISELHMTTKIFDYKAAMAEALAKLPANVEDLTGSEEEGEAALEYMAAAKCMTSAESELYPTPAVVKVGLEAAYVNAIVNAQAGSGAQLAAVEEYRAYIATLTDEEKENSVHKANVEKVNGMLKQTVNSEKSLIPNGWWASDEHLGGFKTTYSSTAQKTFESGTNYNGTAVFPAFNFNECQEVYFGLYAVAAAESWDPYNGVIGTITVNGVSFVGIDPQIGDCYFKVAIANGVLTMVNEKDNSVALTVELPEAVLNGTEGLTIDFNFGYWAKAEVTEMHLKTIEPLSIVDLISNEATVAINGTTAGQPNVYFPRTNWTPDGTHVAMQSLTYDYLNFAQYNAANTAYTVTYTLPKVDFSQCSEVYFGIAAATAVGDCTINVGGASYSYDLNAGYLQMKVVIKGNVLTIIGDGANNVGKILASVELSEAILTGEEALTITWTTAGWSQVEITEMRASVKVKPIS